MSLLNAGRELNQKHLISPRSVYIGAVVNNNDPKKLQRIRVRIHDIHRQVSDNQLPWCLPFTSLFASGAGIGQFGPIPTLNSRVYVCYLDDSPYYPMYLGGTISEDRKLEDFTQEGSATANDYPYVYGKIDRSGNLTLVNTKRDTFEFHHVTGTRIAIDGYGRVQIDVVNSPRTSGDTDTWDPQQQWPTGLTLNVQGNLDINVTESIRVKAGGPMDLHAQGPIDVASGGIIDLNTNSPNPPSSISSMSRDRPEDELPENRLPENNIEY